MITTTESAHRVVSDWYPHRLIKSLAMVDELVDELIKAKYIRRIATGNPKRPWRYIYHADERKRWQASAWETVKGALREDQKDHGKANSHEDGSRAVHFGEAVSKLPLAVLKLALAHLEATHGKKAIAGMKAVIDQVEGKRDPHVTEPSPPGIRRTATEADIAAAVSEAVNTLPPGVKSSKTTADTESRMGVTEITTHSGVTFVVDPNMAVMVSKGYTDKAEKLKNDPVFTAIVAHLRGLLAKIRGIEAAPAKAEPPLPELTPAGTAARLASLHADLRAGATIAVNGKNYRVESIYQKLSGAKEIDAQEGIMGTGKTHKIVLPKPGTTGGEVTIREMYPKWTPKGQAGDGAGKVVRVPISQVYPGTASDAHVEIAAAGAAGPSETPATTAYNAASAELSAAIDGVYGPSPQRAPVHHQGTWQKGHDGEWMAKPSGATGAPQVGDTISVMSKKGRVGKMVVTAPPDARGLVAVVDPKKTPATATTAGERAPATVEGNRALAQEVRDRLTTADVNAMTPAQLDLARNAVVAGREAGHLDAFESSTLLNRIDAAGSKRPAAYTQPTGTAEQHHADMRAALVPGAKVKIKGEEMNVVGVRDSPFNPDTRFVAVKHAITGRLHGITLGHDKGPFVRMLADGPGAIAQKVLYDDIHLPVGSPTAPAEAASPRPETTVIETPTSPMNRPPTGGWTDADRVPAEFQPKPGAAAEARARVDAARAGAAAHLSDLRSSLRTGGTVTVGKQELTVTNLDHDFGGQTSLGLRGARGAQYIMILPETGDGRARLISTGGGTYVDHPITSVRTSSAPGAAVVPAPAPAPAPPKPPAALAGVTPREVRHADNAARGIKSPIERADERRETRERMASSGDVFADARADAKRTADSRPWSMSSSQYQVIAGTTAPHIAEISGVQRQRMSKRELAGYQADRDARSAAAAASHNAWKEGVVAAYRAGQIDLKTPELSRDAKDVILRERSNDAEAGHEEYRQKFQASVSKTPEKGDVMHHPLHGTVEITKVNKNSVSVNAVRDGKRTPVGTVDPNWLSYGPHHVMDAGGKARTGMEYKTVETRQAEHKEAVKKWEATKRDIQASAPKSDNPGKASAEDVLAHAVATKDAGAGVHKVIFPKDVATNLGISSVAARRHLEQLAEQGKLSHLGDNRYRVPYEKAEKSQRRFKLTLSKSQAFVG